jgi:hypothetical protein
MSDSDPVPANKRVPKSLGTETTLIRTCTLMNLVVSLRL